MTDQMLTIDQQLALESAATRLAVLFLCVHNAGRSQMALGWFNHLAGDRAVAWSGGSEPGNEVNPAAIAAMQEIGIDISREFPKPWTDEIVQAADVVVTMGCGDACPLFPGKRYEDWELDDPAGQGVEAVRPIRDEIERRVRTLLGELGVVSDRAEGTRRIYRLNEAGVSALRDQLDVFWRRTMSNFDHLMEEES